MSIPVPGIFAIPELVLLVLESVSEGRSLVSFAITSHYFADLVLPFLWKIKNIHLEYLYCLLPDRTRTSLASSDVCASDWTRYLYYSEHVRSLYMTTCFFSPSSVDPPAFSDIRLETECLVRLLIGPSRKFNDTFKRVQSIHYFPTQGTWQDRVRLFYPFLSPAICSLFTQLPNLRSLQLGSSSLTPIFDAVYPLETLQSLVLYYQDLALIEVLCGFHCPRVTKIRLRQCRRWSLALVILSKLERCCPNLEDISVESTPLMSYASQYLPIHDAVDVFAALAGFNLVHFRFELHAKINMPRSLYEWRPIANQLTNLRSFIMNTREDLGFDQDTSVDLDFVVLLVSSLPLLKVLYVPIIVVREPVCRISKDTYAHPLRTQQIVDCLNSICDYASNVRDIEDGEDRSPGDTWRLVRTLFLGFQVDVNEEAIQM